MQCRGIVEREQGEHCPPNISVPPFGHIKIKKNTKLGVTRCGFWGAKMFQNMTVAPGRCWGAYSTPPDS